MNTKCIRLDKLSFTDYFELYYNYSILYFLFVDFYLHRYPPASEASLAYTIRFKTALLFVKDQRISLLLFYYCKIFAFFIEKHISVAPK